MRPCVESTQRHASGGRRGLAPTARWGHRSRGRRAWHGGCTSVRAMTTDEREPPTPGHPRPRRLTPRVRRRPVPLRAGEDEETVKEDRYETIAQALEWARRNGYDVALP